VSSVTLGSGRSLPCELVIVAIGVKPRVDIASAAGIKINRGIVVDRRMAASCPDVYACGDVAEAYDFVYKENRVIPIWPNAFIGGRTAGLNMVGENAEYPGGTSMNSLKYFGMAMVSAGTVIPPVDSYEALTEKHGDVYRKVVLKDGVIAGMLFTGDIDKSGIVYNLMKKRVNVEDFKQALISDDFGLASLPEEMWQSLLVQTGVPAETAVAAGGQPEVVII